MFHIVTPEKGKPFTIGRKEDCDIRFSDVFVSREHATLEFNAALWNLKNLSSNSVTQVNDEDVSEILLKDGDIIVIDKSLEVNDGDFVVAYIDGEFTLKEFRLDKANNCAWLIPHNDSYSPIKVTEDNDFLIWGVLTYTIKKLHR